MICSDIWHKYHERFLKIVISESSIFVEIINSDGCNLCFLEYLFASYAELDLQQTKPVSSHRTLHP